MAAETCKFVLMTEDEDHVWRSEFETSPRTLDDEAQSAATVELQALLEKLSRGEGPPDA